MKVNVRKLAASILIEAEAADKYINLALKSHSVDNLESNERAALTALVYTVTERRITYDYIISALAGRESARIDPYTLTLLRLGVCQIVSMHSIPDFAAVNETVKLARNPGESSFVNAILRSAVRAKDNLPIPSETKNYRRYLSVKYSFPLGTVKHFDALYGREATEKMLNFFNEEKYTDLTVNTLRTSVESYSQLLTENGFEHRIDPDTGISVRLCSSVNPERLPGFSEGLFLVQDKASLVSSMVINASKGDRIIDVCAAPGGKSFAAAILSGDGADIHSYDIHPSKLSLISDGATRLGLTSLKVAERDATDPDESLLSTADKVICDAPCSGLGVLGKKADLRYKDPSSVSELPELQYSILSASAGYCKVGGELVYSTCTLNPEENENNVSRFLSEHPEFTAVDFSVGTLDSKDGILTLLPHLHATDGFFVAKLRRMN